VKNKILNANNIYSLIRDEYIISFPHELIFDTLELLNRYIKNHNKAAFFTVDSNGEWVFNNPEPTGKVSGPFENTVGTTARTLEANLSNSAELSNLVYDIEIMHQWLAQAHFISSLTATEKMLSIRTLL